jgi:hypothetical protein
VYIFNGFKGAVNEPGDYAGLTGARISQQDDFVLSFGTYTDSLASLAD